MTSLTYFPDSSDNSALEAESVEIALLENESVLQALLRNGYEIPNGCRAGACQSCLMKTEPGKAQKASLVGLKPSQVESGLFLSCSCYPDEPLVVAHSNQQPGRQKTTVLNKTWLNANILQLRLKPDSDFDFRAGQYATLWKPGGEARCYSIASTPEDGYLEFHIKHIPGGAISHWLAEDVQTGDSLEVQGPLGDCFYLPGEQDKPLLLSGIGTGLAPLLGIIRDALTQGHCGPISLVLGAQTPDNFYLVEQLVALAEKHSNLAVHFLSQLPASEPRDLSADSPQRASKTQFLQADIYQWLGSEIANLKESRVYLCGAESFVHKAKKICFLGGAAMSAIHADSFTPYQS